MDAAEKRKMEIGLGTDCGKVKEDDILRGRQKEAMEKSQVNNDDLSFKAKDLKKRDQILKKEIEADGNGRDKKQWMCVWMCVCV